MTTQTQLTQTQWPRVEELFHELADADAQTREVALADEPEPIRQAVLRLFEAEGGEAMITATLRRAARMVTQPESRIGAYQIVREIGHGGMGAVYLGVRADDTYEKQVAIKFVRSGMDSPILRQRFEAERRILARLEHPYIARLLDAGTSSSGQPYFVMEYVEGEPIHQWAERNNLAVRERVKLFLQVCEAVQYAHRNLIVHRDIKPSNILVRLDGTPKLLDFGIAKLLEEETKSSQATAMHAMTPEYASPEQARGEAISVASDVYSLGAVLYDLLTGGPPLPMKGLSPAETERVLCQSDVPLPSMRAPILGRQLRGDLDNIALLALRKSPEERYASVDEFRADLLRYLAGQPVVARQYTFAQRLRKFVARNRRTVTAATAIALSLLIGSAVAIRSAVEAQDARRLAEAERQKAQVQSVNAERKAAEALEQRSIADGLREVADTQRHLAERRFAEQRTMFGDDLRGFYDRVQQLPGSTPARLQLLTMAAKSLERLALDAPNDPQVQLDLASYYQRLGELYGSATNSSLGDKQTGLSFLHKGLAIAERLNKQQPENAAVWTTLASLYARISALLAYVTADPKDAVEVGEKALRAAQHGLSLRPNDFEAQRQMAATLLAPSAALLRRDPRLIRMDRIDRAELMLRAMLKVDPSDLDVQAKLAEALSLQASMLVQQMDLAAAIEKLNGVKNMRESILRASPNDSSIKRVLMITNGHLADAYGRLNRAGDAGSIAANAAMAALGEELAHSDPDNVTAQYDYAMSLTRVATFHRRLKDFPRALAGAQKAVSILDTLKRREGENRVFVGQYFNAMNSVADILFDLGRSAEATEAYLRQVAEWDAYPRRNEDLLTSLQRIRALMRLVNALARSNDVRAIEYARRVTKTAMEVEVAVGSSEATSTRALRYQAEAGMVFAQFAESTQNRSLWIEAQERLSHCLTNTAKLDPNKSPDWSITERERMAQTLVNAVAALNMKYFQ